MRAGDGYPGQQAFPPEDLAGQSGWPPAQSSRPPGQSGWPPAQSSQPPAESGGPGAYPGGPGGYPGGPVTQPGGPVAQPGGPGGPPSGPGGPGKKTWPTWWIVPYLGGAAAVLAVFAIVQLTVLRHPAGHAAAASS